MIRIKEFTKRIGISQEELAKALGVSSNTVSMWANGKRYPTHLAGKAMLDMGMTIEELYGKPYPSSVDQANNDFDRKASFFMNKLFEKIDKL